MPRVPVYVTTIYMHALCQYRTEIVPFGNIFVHFLRMLGNIFKIRIHVFCTQLLFKINVIIFFPRKSTCLLLYFYFLFVSAAAKRDKKIGDCYVAILFAQRDQHVRRGQRNGTYCQPISNGLSQQTFFNLCL